MKAAIRKRWRSGIRKRWRLGVRKRWRLSMQVYVSELGLEAIQTELRDPNPLKQSVVQ